VSLTEAMRQFLDAPRFAVLATVDDGGAPRQTVVWYELRGDRILFNTKGGRGKERNLARDRRVSLCVEHGYRFISIDGHVIEEIRDQETAKTDILRLGVRYDGPVEADRQWRELWSKQERVTYLMSIERVHAPGFEAT
jgi:PPOX class probable F420-dependent enzyme